MRLQYKNMRLGIGIWRLQQSSRGWKKRKRTSCKLGFGLLFSIKFLTTDFERYSVLTDCCDSSSVLLWFELLSLRYSSMNFSLILSLYSFFLRFLGLVQSSSSSFSSSSFCCCSSQFQTSSSSLSTLLSWWTEDFFLFSIFSKVYFGLTLTGPSSSKLCSTLSCSTVVFSSSFSITTGLPSTARPLQ